MTIAAQETPSHELDFLHVTAPLLYVTSSWRRRLSRACRSEDRKKPCATRELVDLLYPWVFCIPLSEGLAADCSLSITGDPVGVPNQPPDGLYESYTCRFPAELFAASVVCRQLACTQQGFTLIHGVLRLIPTPAPNGWLNSSRSVLFPVPFGPTKTVIMG